MTDTTNTPNTTPPAEAHVGTLLSRLQEAVPSAPTSLAKGDARFDNQLAFVRLGVATSLFHCLRTKHAGTAARGLRVALTCSAWAKRQGLDDLTRDRLEVAALLHDLGKIGIPDRVLRKPGKLTDEEHQSMDFCPELTCEILRGSTSDSDLLDVIRYCNNWFDPKPRQAGPAATEIPICSRMLLIANAFDAMTTDHVYRQALSRERALRELLQASGTQFDPRLVVDFVQMLEERPEMLQGGVVDRWLRQLESNSQTSFWNGGGESQAQAAPDTSARGELRFFQRLMVNLQDGVVFTNAEGTVTHWSDAMEGLLGISASTVIGKTWNTSAFNIRDTKSDLVICPLKQCLTTNANVSRPLTVLRKRDDASPIQLSVALVRDDDSNVLGTIISIQDTSIRVNLEEKLETLHHKTTLDALTGISNRAHFDETIKKFTDATIAGGPSYSLIITDIDHFKKVNDIHGHPAGDEALKKFASVLSDHARQGDLVARYGGEEFLLLAASCDNASAAKRAEGIRQSLENTSLPSLNNESVTASFGVTEYQPGDTPETVLARADRALLKAKDNGRNRVIQLGSGNGSSGVATSDGQTSGWFSWFGSSESSSKIDLELDILTPVPADLAIEKLRGFIADHGAEIISVNESQVSIKVNALHQGHGRRTVDQHIGLKVNLTLSERLGETRLGVSALTKTNVHVEIEPIRSRNRRNRHLNTCVRRVVASLRSYLMGEILKSPE